MGWLHLDSTGVNKMRLITGTARVVLFTCLAGMLGAAQAADDRPSVGKVLDVDRNNNTITVETDTGITEYEYDDQLEVTEVGIHDDTTPQPSMRELRKGDLVRVEDTAPGTDARRMLVRRVVVFQQPEQATSRSEPTRMAQRDMSGDSGSAAARGETGGESGRMLPKTASVQPLIALLG
ncbi:MAG: hypothetical protein RKL32_12205, partial [Gammaproteobacteria bacterium]